MNGKDILKVVIKVIITTLLGKIIADFIYPPCKSAIETYKEDRKSPEVKKEEANARALKLQKEEAARDKNRRLQAIYIAKAIRGEEF